MTEADVVSLFREAITVVILIAGPVMLAGLCVGLVVSLFQALTQIQEMTLAFVPKILAIFGTLIVMLPFMLTTLSDFTHELVDHIVTLG